MSVVHIASGTYDHVSPVDYVCNVLGFLIMSLMTEHTAVFIAGRSKPGVSVLIFNTRYVSMGSDNRV